MLRLGVNIDHVATVRQARRTDEPDPVWAAAEAELGGADGITFHLREDRRHINDRDAVLLRQTVATRLNLEMSTVAEIVKIALRLKPHQCTLVPERREELTTEGGLDVVKWRRKVGPVVRRLRSVGIETSAFIEPDREQIIAAAQIGFDAVELCTAAYAEARSDASRRKALQALTLGVELGLEQDLTVHAGHGLTYRNVAAVAMIPGFSEFNIGHSIVSRAVFVGLREAVREMRCIMNESKDRALKYITQDMLVSFDDDGSPSHGDHQRAAARR